MMVKLLIGKIRGGHFVDNYGDGADDLVEIYDVAADD